MESNVFITIFFPIALAIVMFGVGLSLVVDDFKRILVYPKAVTLGLVGQLALVPAAGFAVASLFNFSRPELAVGLVVIAVCVGGSNSTLLNLLVRGDVPLSVTLSAFTNILSVFTIPFLVNLALIRFMGSGQVIQLSVWQTIAQLLLITIVPLAVGMGLNARFPRLTGKANRPVKILSAFMLVMVIVGALIRTGEIVFRGMLEVGLPVIVLDVALMLLGYGLATFLRLNQSQRICLGIEFGIQNGILGVTIASSPLMLNNPAMTITPIVYSLLMLVLGFGFGAAVNLVRRRPQLGFA
ncbi:MAG: bile acid:sodium symporter family protein [Chloroflexi bacterium]|nr:bile acid:sodium symporter family protein [Chloroflexota bacterium]